MTPPDNTVVNRKDLHEDLADLEHGDTISVRTETTEFDLEVFNVETAGIGDPPDTFILWCWPLDRRNDHIRMFFFVSKPGAQYPALYGFDCYRSRDTVEVDGCGRVDEIDLDTE